MPTRRIFELVAAEAVGRRRPQRLPLGRSVPAVQTGAMSPGGSHVVMIT